MTQIICRIDHENKPVVFLADSMNNGRIKAWKEGDDKPRMIGIDYYQNTQPLSEDDSKELAKRFAAATGDSEVYVRQRLPRTYRPRPNILANSNDGSQQGVEFVQLDNSKRGRKVKSTARSEAAKRRMEADKLAAAALNDAGQGGPNLSPDDERLQKLSMAIAQALLTAGL